jgi:hypothetical protein
MSSNIPTLSLTGRQKPVEFLSFSAVTTLVMAAAMILGHYIDQMHLYLKNKGKLGKCLLRYVALQTLVNVLILYLAYYIMSTNNICSVVNYCMFFSVMLFFTQPNFVNNIHEYLTTKFPLEKMFVDEPEQTRSTITPLQMNSTAAPSEEEIDEETDANGNYRSYTPSVNQFDHPN